LLACSEEKQIKEKLPLTNFPVHNENVKFNNLFMYHSVHGKKKSAHMGNKIIFLSTIVKIVALHLNP